MVQNILASLMSAWARIRSTDMESRKAAVLLLDDLLRVQRVLAEFPLADTPDDQFGRAMLLQNHDTGPALELAEKRLNIETLLNPYLTPRTSSVSGELQLALAEVAASLRVVRGIWTEKAASTGPAGIDSSLVVLLSNRLFHANLRAKRAIASAVAMCRKLVR